MVNFFTEMKAYKKLKFFIPLILLAMQSSALDLTQINMAYVYDINAPIRVSYRLVEEGDKLALFYEVRADSVSGWATYFLSQKSYQTEVHDTLTNLSIDTIRVENRRTTVKMVFEKDKNKDLLVVSFYNLKSEYSYVYDVQINTSKDIPDFYPIDRDGLPILDPYVRAEDINFQNSDEYLHVYQYSQPFKGADPPMGQMGPLAPTIDIDSSYMFLGSLGDIAIDNFYLIQRDSLSQAGVTLLKVPYYYPETKRIEELIGPLQYITTESENKSLNSGVDTKAVFERFWINTYGTKYRAKVAIKSFYSKVEESNMLFTDYRRGWKTDRGMLYVVYGKPDEVIRTKSSEVWKYIDGPEFEFIRISTLFAPSFYSLRRNMDYENMWYEQVGGIRKG